MDELSSSQSRPRPPESMEASTPTSKSIGVYDRPEGAGASRRWMSTGLILAVLILIAILTALLVL